jgi:type II secretion system protein N
MKERLRNSKYAKPFFYIIFFLVAFVVFLYSSFPTEGIKQQVISQITDNTPFQAEIGSVSITPPFSLKIKDMTLYRSKDNALKIESLTVSPSVFSLFSSNNIFPFKAKLNGGEIKGILSVNKSGSGLDEIKASVKHVNIDNIPAFMTGSEEAPVLKGALDGNLEIDFAPKALGEFNFTVDGLEVDNLMVKGIKLPALRGLESVFSGNIEGRITNVEELNLKGDGIDLQISGTAPLIWELTKGGVIDLGYRLEITGGEYAKYKGMLMPYLAQQRDGSLGGKIIGTVSNPKFEKGSVKRF